MTPAIPDNYDIPLGYEIVNEPIKGSMTVRSHDTYSFVYVAPIRLRLGENYRCRNGQETGPLIENNNIRGKYQFYSNSLRDCLNEAGKFCVDVDNHPLDIVAHIPKKEKRAEKAKEEKVKDQLIQINMPVHYRPGDPTCTAYLPVSELARIAQLPEVVAEVEKQRKEREIKAGDWFWAYNRPRLCTGTTENHIYDKTLASEKSHCKKINDKSLLAMLEAGVTP